MASTTAINSNTLQLGIGAQPPNPTTPSRFYNGKLDDARVYATALTASQIAALANVGANGAPNAPTLNSPADGATGIGTSTTLSVGVSDPDANPLTVTFKGRPFASGAFATIGQNTGVASGSNTTTSWASLSAGQKFEWFVEVSDGTTTTTGPTWTFNTAPGADPVFIGAGDIADCGRTQDEATAAILSGIPGTVWTAGDNVYPTGTTANYNNCYEPSWGGAIKARTRPVPGNHDWSTGTPPETIAPYLAYFGASATGTGGESYYSYDIAGSNWHVIVLDSECQLVPGGCADESVQEKWLGTDLAANSTKNVIALWHRPRYSSGVSQSTAVQPLWDDLYKAGVDILLVGHDHHYERFAPMKSGATLSSPPVADPTFGIRQFIVGTGGAAFTGLGTALATTEVRNNTTYGVLKLTLHASTYDWAFLPVAVPPGSSTFTDSGTGSVHAAPNTAPVAVADSYSTAQNTALVQAAPGVLANDTDADTDPLTAVLDANVTHGSLTLNANGSFTYTPTTGYSGPDSFTYHAHDGTANSNVVTVSLTVTAPTSTSISGVVSKAGGAGPLTGSYVTAYEATSATWTNYGVTDATGAYAINLPAGSYKLLVQTNTAGYPDTWHGGSTFATATTVVVDGAETVNITIAPSTSISGVVSKAGGAGPLTGSYVTAYEATSATWTNYGVTDATGAYAINLPAGSYKLLVQTNTAGYPDTWHGGSTFATATTVVVDGAETVNITIAPSTSISGVVSKAGGAGPLTGSYVTAYEATSATWTNYGVTDATGAYAINLPAGSYKLLVQTNTAGYPDTWHGGSTFATATTVVVDGAETVNITIAPSTSISGVVSKAGGAGPLTGSYVTAYEATSATWTNYGVTDATGAYAINLPAGSYKLLVQTNTAGYPDTWHGGSTFATATTVVVDGAETVNITIAPSTSISGVVSKAGGAGPLTGSYVTAYEATSATWTNYGVTDATGAYAINLPAGSYKLLVQTNTAGYPDTWHGGSTFATATTVVVDGAETVNITIAPSGSNTAPVAVADSYSTPQDTALVQAAPGVLANDTDANSDPLTAVLNANVTHGSLTLNANGSFTYTPTTGYSGPDSFTYHANDGAADSNVVTVSLTVNARPARLVAVREQRAGQLHLPQPWQPRRHPDLRGRPGGSGGLAERNQPERNSP